MEQYEAIVGLLNQQYAQLLSLSAASFGPILLMFGSFGGAGRWRAKPLISALVLILAAYPAVFFFFSSLQTNYDIQQYYFAWIKGGIQGDVPPESTHFHWYVREEWRRTEASSVYYFGALVSLACSYIIAGFMLLFSIADETGRLRKAGVTKAFDPNASAKET